MSSPACRAAPGKSPHWLIDVDHRHHQERIDARPGGTCSRSAPSSTLSALSFDPKDWPWKLNHDTGAVYEQLVADLSKSKQYGGPYAFKADAWLPSDAIRGELAESWQVQDNSLALVFKLRKGVMFPDKPGVMKARELTADDVVFSFNYRDKSPRKLPSTNAEIDHAEALDRYTVAFYLKEYIADWDSRLGYGYNSAIYPKEVTEAGAADWKNVNGTGPFMLTDYIAANSHTYTKNPTYWGTETVNGTTYEAAVRRQGDLPHHQGRGVLDAADRVPHRQARHSRGEDQRAEPMTP